MPTYTPNQTLPVAIPDNGTTTLTFDVPDIGLVESVTVSVAISHDNCRQIELWLYMPPSVAEATIWTALLRDNDIHEDGVTQLGSVGSPLTFDDAAPTSLYASDPPYSGSYKLSGGVWDFTEFIGQPSEGTWSLEVDDEAVGDTGELLQVRLNINGESEVIEEPEVDGFTVHLTPLIAPDGTVGEGDLIEITQYADLSVTHPLNAGRTAEVTLSMHDEAVADLEPYEFALRIKYRRGEVVFWGQAWFEESYEAGTITIRAQDPTLRLQHHYLRFGDDALDNVEQGHLTADSVGIFLAVDAARNTAAQDTRGDPDLGIAEGRPSDISLTTLTNPVEVERGQEINAVIDLLTAHRSGPDIDYHPLQTLPASNYVELDCYGAEDGGLGRDLTATDPDAPTGGEVVFDYGLGQDNLTGLTNRPGRPTTHAHIVDGRLHRKSWANVDGTTATGPFVDWVAVDLKDVTGSGTSLPDMAKARVAAYGIPPKFIELEMRPDAAQTRFYGHPDYPNNTGDFYIGDRVTVRALRGERSLETTVRITEVQLAQAGWRSPAVTRLKVVPTIAGDPVEEEQ